MNSSTIFHFNGISPRTINAKYNYIVTTLDNAISILENTIEETELYMDLLVDDLSNKSLSIKINRYIGISNKTIEYSKSSKSIDIYNIDGLIYKSISISSIVYIGNDEYIQEWYNSTLPEEYSAKNLLIIKYIVGNSYKTIRLVLSNGYLIKSYIQLVNYISRKENIGLIQGSYGDIYIRNRVRDIYTKISKIEEQLKRSDLEMDHIVNYILNKKQDISKLLNKYLGIANQKDILAVIDTINNSIDNVWKCLKCLF